MIAPPKLSKFLITVISFRCRPMPDRRPTRRPRNDCRLLAGFLIVLAVEIAIITIVILTR